MCVCACVRGGGGGDGVDLLGDGGDPRSIAGGSSKTTVDCTEMSEVMIDLPTD